MQCIHCVQSVLKKRYNTWWQRKRHLSIWRTGPREGERQSSFIWSLSKSPRTKVVARKKHTHTHTKNLHRKHLVVWAFSNLSAIPFQSKSSTHAEMRKRLCTRKRASTIGFWPIPLLCRNHCVCVCARVFVVLYTHTHIYIFSSFRNGGVKQQEEKIILLVNFFYLKCFFFELTVLQIQYCYAHTHIDTVCILPINYQFGMNIYIVSTAKKVSHIHKLTAP